MFEEELCKEGLQTKYGMPLNWLGQEVSDTIPQPGPLK
jgi:hypothetical protein